MCWLALPSAGSPLLIGLSFAPSNECLPAGLAIVREIRNHIATVLDGGPRLWPAAARLHRAGGTRVQPSHRDETQQPERPTFRPHPGRGSVQECYWGHRNVIQLRPPELRWRDGKHGAG